MYIYYTLTTTPWKTFGKKKFFLQLERFADKAIFNFHSFDKIGDFVITQYGTTIFYPFYLNYQA